MTNNNSGVSGGKKTYTSIAYQFPCHTVGHKDGANTVANNSPGRGLDTLIRQLQIRYRYETNGSSDMKGGIMLQ